ncbi:hypothetical protein [Streptomyces sp. NPDC050564]|uniref:hypothetical protein n=1 Tax=Streptomyces sp. NPDC050564 TaxID=3365631 RepID=UPI0037A9D7CF
MNDAPRLLSEDREEYERILDEALRAAPHRADLAAVGERLSPKQLRTLALNATDLITAGAATEYQHYVRVREEIRGSASPSRSASAPPSSAFSRSGTRPAAPGHHAPAGLGHRFGAAVLGAGPPGGRRISDGVTPQRWARMSYGRRLLAALLGLRVRPEVPTAAGAWTTRTSEQPVAVRTPARTPSARHETPAPETTESAGAGAFAVFAVLAPVLSGTAAAIFFLVGFVLKVLTAESEFARTMFTAGWLFGAVGVGAIVFCVVVLLVTALRGRGQSTREAAGYHEPSEELARAREAWREALLERGIMPFLREALADPRTAALRRTAPPVATSRIPQVGYDRPGFSAPDDGPGPAPAPRPSFTSPEFTSPDFGGPEPESE